MASSCPNLPTISFHSLTTKPSSVLSLQPLPPSQSPSSSQKLSLSSLVSDQDSVTVVNADEAVALANAAVQAAINGVSLSSILSLISFDEIGEIQREAGGALELSDFSSPPLVVRSSSRSSTCFNRRRRRRQKALSYLEEDDDLGSRERQQLSSRSSYLSSSSAYLTAREEAEFSSDLKEGARLEAARKRIWGERRRELEDQPTTSEWAEAVGMKKASLERAVLRASQSGERITRSYRRLVVSIATAYQGKGLALQDLIQEGSIGLLRGAEKFDPQKGYKLSTYVYWWIKQAIIRALAKKSRIIRLPGSMCEMVARIAKANTSLKRSLRRWPTYDEIADMIGVDVSVVRLASESSRAPISLDQNSSRLHGSMKLQDIISGPEETRPEIMVKRQLMKQNLHKLLNTELSEREEIILRLHFGLNGETPRSCDEIGRVLHLSRERIRQIRGIALAKLRDASSVLDI